MRNRGIWRRILSSDKELAGLGSIDRSSESSFRRLTTDTGNSLQELQELQNEDHRSLAKGFCAERNAGASESMANGVRKKRVLNRQFRRLLISENSLPKLRCPPFCNS